ncbi:uncharacterized protein PHACADRAFT_176772 [Phanerochaete carnosa HHB-10118-sp]|uniref:BAR-domain-containing protein n=1 Tax=Phanerochaete carnosa (strain HHB-10118-sp) TaxID=650164 RepID=K5WQW2_PHACS|nr:uncharacterized protein PHACADRAFT_176772 [Phanerochaete carnosa HHB-10118-sp]EKM52757.1 hypothetical protein PHACADRAFT_176772 [Phanerochaete carnosa HHB-10118-sp]
MASKQLGKLRQWAGEVISVRDKTVLSEEFRELEHDVELRRRGLSRLHVASQDYRRALSKKRVSEAVDHDEKLMSIDALGVVMIQHGEEFGDDSAFGTSLVSLGRAHCQIATLQESYSVLFQDTYLASLQRAEDDIKEYQAQRKKLDSRRLAFDAAGSKLEKVRNGKKEKEKEKQEAEDDYDISKSRYEECAEDVRARMCAIQEAEIDQLRDLTSFLDTELHFVEQYLEVLREVKVGWVDDATLASMERSSRSRPQPPISELRPIRERRKSVSNKAAAGSDDSSAEEEASTKPSHKKSLSMRKPDSGTSSKPPSRPPSRNERKRVESGAGIKTDKEKDKHEKSSRMSVADWASSKMGSLTGRGKKEKHADALIQDNETDSDSDDARTQKARRQSTSSRSSPTKTKTTPNASPLPPSRTLRLPAKKVALALHDFRAASQDELSFKAGDQINVLSEVLDGWWMGELNSKTGLFPTTYTEIINASSSSLTSKPRLPPRPTFTPNGSQPGSRASPAPSHEDLTPAPEQKQRDPPKWLSIQPTGDSLAESEDGAHPFGDHLVASSRSPLNGTFYAESVASSGDEDEGHDDHDDHDDRAGVRRLVEPREEDGAHQHPAHGNGRLDDESKAPRAVRPALPSRQPSSAKRPPPPPPPPRRATLPGSAPPIPSRPGGGIGSMPSSQSTSTNASFVSIGSGVAGDGLTGSPFD